MKSKLALLVGVFAVSLLALMIGVMIGFRASPPLSFGAVPPSAIPAAEATLFNSMATCLGDAPNCSTALF